MSVIRGKAMPTNTWGVERDFEAQFSFRLKGFDRRSTRHLLASRIARVLSRAFHCDVEVSWDGDVVDGSLVPPSAAECAGQEALRFDHEGGVI
jgi:hypothetical protein